jgi:predicted nucleotidyltransferase
MFEQDRVVIRIQQRVMAEDDILVCFLSGSYGRGTQDAFSDLDVVLVFGHEDSRESAYEVRQEFVRSVLPYVPANSFDAIHVRPYFHVALYSNGAKVDYRYETKESLKPNIWDREIRLLKDSDGWGREFQEASLQLSGANPLPKTTNEEIAALDERFWIMFMDVYRQVLRGDYAKPFLVYLQLISFTLPTLLSLLPVEDPVRDALICSAYNRDTTATAAHLRDLLEAYLAARQSIIKRHRLLYMPNETLERELLRKINQ